MSAIRADLEKLETGLYHEMGDLRYEMKELELRIRYALQEVHGEMLLIKWSLAYLSPA